ncbi:VWA domain-containing protein [Aeromicrobium sp. A1-2]|uniref:vWA domain-containing protein n=1 Tax=Aeromicrobium sp. A1-2 TaxID=2107713 RepID=UPI0013C2F59D|nr:VWA domain-containing protein [Aeromicrobium sp. A1-2]
MLGGKQLVIALSTAGVLLVGIAAGGPVGAEDSVIGQGGGSVVLVLDGSGSMKESSGDGRTRMEAAQAGLRSVIKAVPADAKVGLRAYGSTISDGKGSCQDSELLVPVDTVDRPALTAGVKKLRPLGNTPIAYSLKQAFKDLPDKGPRSIVLVSDGEENCGGDPCEVARDLRKQGTDFYLDVVGLQVDAKARDQLTCIASAGGGTYYDVQDISRLDSTLKRASVRAARGYVENGLAVEGGTSASAPAAITDGQWLDTIGDSGVEHYSVPDPGKGTLHLSVSTRTTSDDLTASERLEIAVTTADGRRCAESDASVVGVGNTRAPYAAYTLVTPKVKADCGAGPYVLTVQPPKVEGVKPLEILVRTEPEVLNGAQLTESSSSQGYGDVTGPADNGPITPVLGSVSFTGAPALDAGRYSDTIVAGETLMYRVRDVGWGQQAVCDLTLGAADGAVSSANVRATQARVYGPFRTEVTEVLGKGDDGVYAGKDLTLHVASPALAYANRQSRNKVLRGSDSAGDVYCGVSVRATSSKNDVEIGEIPLTLSVAVVGDVAGAPEFATPPKKNADEKADTDGSPGLSAGLIVGLGLAALVLLGILLAVLRRRLSRQAKA